MMRKKGEIILALDNKKYTEKKYKVERKGANQKEKQFFFLKISVRQIFRIPEYRKGELTVA